MHSERLPVGVPASILVTRASHACGRNVNLRAAVQLRDSDVETLPRHSRSIPAHLSRCKMDEMRIVADRQTVAEMNC